MPASAEYFTSMYYPAVLITHTNLILKEFGLNSGARREIEQIMFIVKVGIIRCNYLFFSRRDRIRFPFCTHGPHLRYCIRMRNTTVRVLTYPLIVFFGRGSCANSSMGIPVLNFSMHHKMYLAKARGFRNEVEETIMQGDDEPSIPNGNTRFTHVRTSHSP